MEETSAILDVLMEAVLAGAVEVVRARAEGSVGARYKDATELVTEADERADAVMGRIFEARLANLDPSIALCLEESGVRGHHAPDWHAAKWIGADPLDGTTHFACGGSYYAVQAHYTVGGVPMVGVICQPEVFLPLAISAQPMGRIAFSVRGEGAWFRTVSFSEAGAELGDKRRLSAPGMAVPARLVGCVPLAAKMTAEERARALGVLQSDLMGATTGLAGAAANILMTVFGGHHFYANFGAGIDLDLMPGQVIAEGAGLCVWGPGKASPVWRERRQPMIVALNEELIERVWTAAGL